MNTILSMDLECMLSIGTCPSEVAGHLEK